MADECSRLSSFSYPCSETLLYKENKIGSAEVLSTSVWAVVEAEQMHGVLNRSDPKFCLFPRYSVFSLQCLIL